MTKTLTVVFLFAGCALAQTPVTVARIFDNQLRNVESEIVSLVEAMPADKIDFTPSGGEFKGVRTFAEQAKHASAVLYIVAAAAKGEKPPVETGGEAGPATVKSKEDVVKFMKEAFAYAHTATGALTPENLTDMVPSPFGQGQMAKGALMTIAVSHTFDHYGQMVVYARMNKIVPPASR